jgi:hypothetical protein
MRKRVVIALSILAGLTLAISAWAQEGHPLSGTWHGEWHPAPGQTTRIVMYMKWDGKDITGIINPGPNSMPIKSAAFQGWNVHVEADTKDKVHVTADGKMDQVGSYHRTISGTWTQGPAKGEFKLTRD